MVCITSTDEGHPLVRPSYGFTDNDGRFPFGKCDKAYDHKSGVEFRQDDILQVILNTKDRAIKVGINNQNYWTVFSGIETGENIKYKMSLILDA